MAILQVIAGCFERKSMEKLYEGKAKILYQAHEQHQIVQYFKDDATAFNGEKKGTILKKGIYNCAITSRIFRILREQKIPNHFISQIDDRNMLTHQATLIPLEVVVRNKIAGSLAKRLGESEGTSISQPIVELYYKNDALGDPMVNDEHVLVMKILNGCHLNYIRLLAQRINRELLPRFLAVDLELIDFKLEFGYDVNRDIILIDEITPDSCRLWDALAGERLDKDRFRRDMGKVEESYKEVHDRVLSNLFC